MAGFSDPPIYPLNLRVTTAAKDALRSNAPLSELEPELFDLNRRDVVSVREDLCQYMSSLADTLRDALTLSIQTDRVNAAREAKRDVPTSVLLSRTLQRGMHLNGTLTPESNAKLLNELDFAQLGADAAGFAPPETQRPRGTIV